MRHTLADTVTSDGARGIMDEMVKRAIKMAPLAAEVKAKGHRESVIQRRTLTRYQNSQEHDAAMFARVLVPLYVASEWDGEEYPIIAFRKHRGEIAERAMKDAMAQAEIIIAGESDIYS